MATSCKGIPLAQSTIALLGDQKIEFWHTLLFIFTDALHSNGLGLLHSITTRRKNICRMRMKAKEDALR